MGSVCCCFTVSDVGENAAASNDHNHSNCQCFSCCFHNIINKCGAVFGRAQETAVTSANQGPSSSNAVVTVNSSCNTISSQDSVLPNNAAPTQPQVQQEVAFRRQDKSTSQSRVEPEPVGDADVEITQRLLQAADNLIKLDCGGGCKEYCPESPEKENSSKMKTGFLYAVSSSEDEDVCPTCLEEYTPENPKISTKCSHHYHLSCIYEWQERSEKCPVCGKLMQFEETN